MDDSVEVQIPIKGFKLNDLPSKNFHPDQDVNSMAHPPTASELAKMTKAQLIDHILALTDIVGVYQRSEAQNLHTIDSLRDELKALVFHRDSLNEKLAEANKATAGETARAKHLSSELLKERSYKRVVIANRDELLTSLENLTSQRDTALQTTKYLRRELQIAMTQLPALDTDDDQGIPRWYETPTRFKPNYKLGGATGRM